MVQKCMTVELPGVPEEMVLQYDGRSECVAVIGADSFIGARMTRELSERGRKVVAFGESPTFPAFKNCVYEVTDYSQFDLPAECNSVVFCHDVAKDRVRHLQALENLCASLARSYTPVHQVHLSYFSSSYICAGGKGTIREADGLRPHNLRELAICHAEQMLSAWGCMTRGSIVANVFRHGELYGEKEDWPTPAGYVNESLALARRGENVRFSGNLNQLRTLTHVRDLVAAAIAVMDQEFVSGTFNLPGYKTSAYRCLAAIARQYGVDFDVTGEAIHSDNLLPFSTDCVLSLREFKNMVPQFVPRYRFRDWIRTQNA